MKVTGDAKKTQPVQHIKFSYGGQSRPLAIQRSNSYQQLQQATTVKMHNIGSSPIIHRRDQSQRIPSDQYQPPISFHASREATGLVPQSGLQTRGLQNGNEANQAERIHSKSLQILEFGFQSSQVRVDKHSPQLSPRSQQVASAAGEQRHLQSALPNVSQPANLLKKERIIMVDESDHKLELEVLRMKYKALEERYNQLEHQFHHDAIPKHPRHANEIEEDANDELPSSDQIEQLMAERIDQKFERLKMEFSRREEQLQAEHRDKVDRLTREIKQGQRKIAQLQAAVQRSHGDNLLSPRSAQDKSRRESILLRQQSTTSLANFEFELQNQKVKIEQLTAELTTRNKEFESLREKYQQMVESSEAEGIARQKNAQLREQELLKIETRLEGLGQRHQKELDQQKERLQGTIDEYRKQLLRLEEELLQKKESFGKLNSEMHLLQLSSAKSAEELRRMQNDALNQQSTLQQEIKTIKLNEEALKQSVRKLTDSNRQLGISDEDKTAKISLLTGDLKACKMILEENRREAADELKDAESRLTVSKKRIIELEGQVAQMKLQLQHTKNFPVTINIPQRDNSQTIRNKQELLLLVERKNQELQSRRIEYEGNLRRLRQECEDSYRETLEMYENKILELERKLNRRFEDEKHSHKRTHTSQSKMMKRVVSEHLFNQLESNSSTLIEELQRHVEEYQLKVQRIIEACKAEFSTRGQSYLQELKSMTIGLSARIEYSRNQNTKLKVKATHNDAQLKRNNSRRKLDAEVKDSAALQALQTELGMCKKAMVEYEVLLAQAQAAKKFAPKANNDSLQEKVAILQEKVQFYKEKNSQLDKRTNDLLHLNSTLKLQLQEATRTPAGQSTAEQIQKLIQQEQANMRLQEKNRELGDEIIQIRGEHLFKLQHCEREWQSKLNQQEQTIVELSVKMSTLKTEVAVSENELKLHRQTLQHREGLLAEATNKVAAMRKDLNELSQERRKRQEAESNLAETTSRLNSTINERNHFEAENASMKKHVGYLEKQLLSANEKASSLGSNNLAIDLQLTQAKTAALFHERRNEQLTQEVKTLQRYRAECDAAANEDRHRMNQLEVKLRDSYYELEKANSTKQTLESELALLKSSSNTQKQQLLKLGQAKRDLSSQLNKLRIEGKYAPLPLPQRAQDHLAAQQYEQKIATLEEELKRVKERLQHAQGRLAEAEKLSSKKESEASSALTSQLQLKFAALTEAYNKLLQHSSIMELEKQNFESQARAKISQLEETLNFINSSNSSTERSHQEMLEDQGKELLIKTLSERVKYLEKQLSEFTEVYEDRFELVNKEFHQRFVNLEQSYQVEIDRLQNELGAKEPAAITELFVEFGGLGYLLERIRANCRNSLELISEIQLRNEEAIPPLEGLIETTGDTVNQLDELIRCYNALQGSQPTESDQV